MRALRCLGGGRVSIVEAEDPVAADGEALIQIEASAVCGSERPIFERGVDALRGAAENAVNGGHEACGIVIDPGSSSFKIGDRVGLSAVHACGTCDRCRAGREVQCREGWKFTARAGWHAELATLPGISLVELPESTEPAVGAMLSGDTLGVAGPAFRRDPTGPGDRCLVIGLGPVGLGHVAIRAFTGAEVIAIEPSAYRRAVTSESKSIQSSSSGARSPTPVTCITPVRTTHQWCSW